MSDYALEDPRQLRRKIDLAIDYRRHYRPWDISNVRVRMTPEQMLEALKFPRPLDFIPGRTLTYRGFLIEAID